ncbi:MAG: NUDIX hydrolase [Clostridia bacterium]|nr:NUDIX hydrolase [Clostridia bacterium]
MNDEALREVVTSRKSIYDGHILKLQKWTVTLPGGGSAYREIVLHKGASAVVPVDEEGNVYLVRQYRTPLDEVLTEIPAGKLDYAGEEYLSAAKRELKEETGFTAESWTHLTTMRTTPGFTNETIAIYLARGLTQGETHPDDDEFIETEKLPLSKAIDMIHSGEINDSKTIAGLLLAAEAIGDNR